MKTLTFKYTKADGSTSERTLLAMVTPGGDKYAGVDLSSLEADEAQKFIDAAKGLYEQYVESIALLQKGFDLKHSYRQFNASGVSDLTVI